MGERVSVSPFNSQHCKVAEGWDLRPQAAECLIKTNPESQLLQRCRPRNPVDALIEATPEGEASQGCRPHNPVDALIEIFPEGEAR